MPGSLLDTSRIWVHLIFCDALHRPNFADQETEAQKRMLITYFG